MVGFRDQFGLHHYPNETLDNSSSVNVTDSLCSEDVAASAKLVRLWIAFQCRLLAYSSWKKEGSASKH